jgi:hypothetical protein
MAHDGGLKARYESILALHRESGELLRNLTGHSEAIWYKLRKNDREIARLWREIFEIERL